MNLSAKQKIALYVFLSFCAIGIIVGLIFLLKPKSGPPTPDKCEWKTSDWGECDTKTNIQTRSVTCISSDGTECDRCIQSDKPPTSQACTPQGFCCDTSKPDGTGCSPNTNGCGSLIPVQNCGDCKATTWPSNVYFFSPEDSNIQSDIYEVFQKQGGTTPENNGQFSEYNYAFLFMPGTYNNIDVPIGYYTHVAGLGRQISDVVLNGNGPHVDNSSTNPAVGALNNFWRSCENMKVTNPSDGTTNQGTMIWAVSQAASLRSMDIEGDLQLFGVEDGIGGYASAGFISNSKANVVTNGAQQQFVIRNSQFDSFKAPLWNQVLVGCDLTVPAEPCCTKDGSGRTLLTVPQTPLIAEKPYLVATDPTKKAVLSIIRPPVQKASSGQTITPVANSVEIKEDGYFIATPGVTSAIINAALKTKNAIIFCPGIYNFEETINLSGQLLFGLGVPRIISKNAQNIVEGYGDICGIIFEAAEGTGHKTILVNMNVNKPSYMWDIYCRVGGGSDESKSYSADTMLYVGGDYSVVDNSWCWVADHYASNAYTGWDKADCNTGVRIGGNNVICYGMFSEHNHNVNLQWDGDNGEMYMFQSEFNYFPKTQDSFKNTVSYNVNPSVKNHKIRGAGAYSFFPCSSSSATDIYALAGFRFPKSVNVDYKTVFTVYLDGYGGVNNVIVDETGQGDSYKVEWVDNGKGDKPHPKCSPNFNRPLGNTMLKYQCNPDSCSCVGCNPPSTCVNGECVPQNGCTSDQKAAISKACPNGCACGAAGSMWKCTTNNQPGCYDQAGAMSQCGGNASNVCQWW